MMRIIKAHNILRGFLVFSCADILLIKIWSQNALILVETGNLSILSLIRRPLLP